MRPTPDILGEKLDALAERQRLRFANEYEAEQAPPDPDEDSSDMG